MKKSVIYDANYRIRNIAGKLCDKHYRHNVKTTVFFFFFVRVRCGKREGAKSSEYSSREISLAVKSGSR